jgi:uncharacterized lipoprotein YddW (UPF0748 family)
MKNKLFSLILLFTICATTFAQTIYPKRELRGVWISTISNLDWPSASGLSTATQKTELKTILQKLAASGINTVFFQVRPSCDAFYNSSIEPWSQYITGTQGSAPSPYYDPLQFLLVEAHKLGIEVHGWINPYRAIPNTNSSATVSNMHVSVQHPSWCVTYNTLKVLDPGKLAVRNYVTKVVMDIVRRYNIDGIHFDDYFYPYPQSGITFNDAGTFTTEPRGFTNKNNWRRDNVNLLINAVHDSIKAFKNHIKFGISPFGIYKNGVPAGTTGLDAYSELYCDPLQWLANGNVDYLTPQLYWKIGGNQDYPTLLNWWATQCATNNRHLYSGNYSSNIGASSWGVNEIKNQIKLNRANVDVQGEAYFSSPSITDNYLKFGDTLKQTINKYKCLVPTMPWLDNVNPNPVTALAYTNTGGKTTLTWNLPAVATDNDSAKKIVIYKFGPTEVVNINLAKNILHILPTDSVTYTDNAVLASNQLYKYVVTTLDKLNNESTPEQINVCNGCDAIPPTTLATVGNSNVYQTNNFTVNFTDVDNPLGSGIDKSYYLAANYNGSNWYANGSNGFAMDNFDTTAISTNWLSTTGTWAMQSNALVQTDNVPTNTMISAAVNQTTSNGYLYNWQAKITGTGTNRRAGMHFMCSSNTQTNRGDSYLAWVRLDLNDVVIYKVTANVLSANPVAVFGNITLTANTWFDVKVNYDRTLGKIKMFINDNFIGSYTDAMPITTGSYVSFRSGNTSCEINDLRVYSLRTTTANISVGAAASNDIRFQNPTPGAPAGLVKSITIDVAGNVSTVDNKYVNVDYTLPTAPTLVNDGTTTDVSFTLNNSTIQANWTTCTDANSAISTYEYAIGTGAGLTDVVPYTNNGNSTLVTHNGLNLTLGTTYYVSVKAINGAGLNSVVTTSNGQVYNALSSLSTLGNETKSFTLYPNPSTDIVTITSNNAFINTVEIIDIAGKVVYNYNSSDALKQQHLVTISGFENGVYIVKINANNVYKLIKN